MNPSGAFLLIMSGWALLAVAVAIAVAVSKPRKSETATPTRPEARRPTGS